MNEITVETLMQILDRAGGSDENGNISGTIEETDFETLGYESLTILEAAGIVEREYGVQLDEAALFGANTPRELVDVINQAFETSSS